MRFRKETIEWMDDSTNISRKEQVVVSRLTHTMRVYGNYERDTGTTKEVWIEYTKKTGLFHGI
jgi:hypothetical protein